MKTCRSEPSIGFHRERLDGRVHVFHGYGQLQLNGVAVLSARSSNPVVSSDRRFVSGAHVATVGPFRRAEPICTRAATAQRTGSDSPGETATSAVAPGRG